MSKKKIIIVAPALSMGGMERASVNTANGLSELGVKVIFISLFDKDHFFHLSEEIELIEPSGFNKSKLNFFRTVKWVRKNIKCHQPETILTFNKFYGAITAISILGLKIPHFISERSSPLYEWNLNHAIFNQMAYTVNPPTGVLAQTKVAKTYQEKYFKHSKIRVIPNSVRHISLFPEIERKKIILAVGRLNDHLKGFDLLLEAFSRLKNDSWKLNIAGGDKEGAELKRQAKRLGIQNRINFLGKVEQIDKCYAEAGIFVIPSRSEGFPNVLLEAMSAGCPCIAFDFIAGPRELITHGKNGLIVENGNTNELATTIDYLIENDKQRIVLGEKAKYVREEYSLSYICSKINNFIFNEPTK